MGIALRKRPSMYKHSVNMSDIMTLIIKDKR